MTTKWKWCFKCRVLWNVAVTLRREEQGEWRPRFMLRGEWISFYSTYISSFHRISIALLNPSPKISRIRDHPVLFPRQVLNECDRLTMDWSNERQSVQRLLMFIWIWTIECEALAEWWSFERLSCTVCLHIWINMVMVVAFLWLTRIFFGGKFVYSFPIRTFFFFFFLKRRLACTY